MEEAYGRGLRHFGLLHDSDASVPLGDVYTNSPRYGGLTPFGSAVVEECNRLGILIDLAHANLQTTEAALKITTRPVIISHTGLDTQLGSNPSMAQMMRPRLISKEQAKWSPMRGMIGVWTHLADTPLEYAKNVRAMVDVIGVDHVCIGTDTKLTQPGGRRLAASGRPRPRRRSRWSTEWRVGERTNQAWQDQTAGFYYVVVDAMLKTGFTPDEIGKIGGGNSLRIFGRPFRNRRSSELSGHKLQGRLKTPQPPTGRKRSGGTCGLASSHADSLARRHEQPRTSGFTPWRPLYH